MDIKVNAKEWNGLETQDQKRIEGIVQNYFKDGRIVPDVATPRSGDQRGLEAELAGFCETACNAAEAAAKIACNLIPNPAGKALCIVAATAGGIACRSLCD